MATVRRALVWGSMLLVAAPLPLLGAGKKDAKKQDKDSLFGTRESSAPVWPVWKWVRDDLSGKPWRLWGLIDKDGKIVVKMLFARIGSIGHGRVAFAWVDAPDKLGYMDYTGKPLIRPQFEEARQFIDDVAIVRIKRRWYLIDKAGRVLPNQADGFSSVQQMDEWPCLAWRKDKAGVINRRGHWVVTPRYTGGLAFSEGLCCVMTINPWQPKVPKAACGFIDAAGRVVLPPRWAGGMYFSEGLAPVNVGGRPISVYLALGGKWGFINRKGNMVIAPQYAWAIPHVDGSAWVCVGDNSKECIPRRAQWCLIDTKGKRISAMYSKGVSAAAGSLIAVAKGGTYDEEKRKHVGAKWGAIDRKGKIRIPLVYDKLDGFSGGLGLALKDGHWMYLTEEGKVVWREADSPQAGRPLSGW